MIAVGAWRKNEGEMEPVNWGNNSKVPMYFQDEEVKLKAAKWWRSHQPKQGAKSLSSHLTVFFQVTRILGCR